MADLGILLHRLAEAYGSFSADQVNSDDVAHVPEDVAETIGWLEDIDPAAAEAARRAYVDRIRLVHINLVSPGHLSALTERLTSTS